jgi:hypothetical protein
MDDAKMWHLFSFEDSSVSVNNKLFLRFFEAAIQFALSKTETFLPSANSTKQTNYAKVAVAQ